MNRLFYVLLIFWFLSSCQEQKIQEKEYELISIRKDCIRDDYLLSDLIDIKEVIPLEKHEKGMIGRAKEIIVTDSNIFVRNSNNYNSLSIIIYNRVGKYLKRIIGTGKGPEEIIRPDDMTFDHLTNHLIVLDKSQRKVVFYDQKGQYTNHFNFDFYAHSLEIVEDSLLAFFSEGEFNLFVTNFNGREVYHQFEHDPMFQMGNSNSFIRDAQQTYFTRWIDDTLYNISRNMADPSIVIDFGDQALTRKKYAAISPSGMDRLIPPGVMYNVKPLGFTKDFFLFYFGYNKGNICIYNRNTMVTNPMKFEKNNLDITNGIYPFWPGGSYRDSLFIACLHLGRIDEPQTFNFSTQDLAVDSEDNPIVLLYDFKVD